MKSKVKKQSTWLERLESLIRPTQSKLFCKLFQSYPNAISKHGSYILVPGQIPIMLIAHLDTVHKTPVRDICISKDGNIWMSPQGIGGDDRCGVFAIMEIYHNATKKPWLLFACDEEIGGIGSRLFANDYKNGILPAQMSDIKLLVEIDRRGGKDAVYYDCANNELEDYITSKGFKTAYGSFSDISVLAPALEVGAVNLSSGYHNAHTEHEYINLKELKWVIQRTSEIVSDAANPSFQRYAYIPFIPKSYQKESGSVTIWDVYDYQFKNHGCDQDYTIQRRLIYGFELPDGHYVIDTTNNEWLDIESLAVDKTGRVYVYDDVNGAWFVDSDLIIIAPNGSSHFEFDDSLAVWDDVVDTENEIRVS